MAARSGPAVTMLVQGENGVFTIFSLAHLLFGALVHLLWLVLGLGDVWISGLLISSAAMLFEMAESSQFVGGQVWGRTWGHAMGIAYKPDTLNNAFSDALFSNLGFFAVQLTDELSNGAAAARTGVAIGCAAVAILFVSAFCVRQKALGDLPVRPPQPGRAVERRWFGDII
jgi:hypothetical protein